MKRGGEKKKKIVKKRKERKPLIKSKKEKIGVRVESIKKPEAIDKGKEVLANEAFLAEQIKKAKEEFLKNKFKTEEKKEPKAEIKQARIISEKTDRDKKFIMWSGVTFIMILIVIIYAINAKSIIKENRNPEEIKSEASDWDEMKNQVSQKIDEMKNNMEKIKGFGNETNSGLPINASSTPGPNTSTTTNPNLNKDIEIIKEKLEELSKQENSQYYFIMADEKAEALTKNLENIKVGDTVIKAKELLGEPDYDQKFYDREGTFTIRELRYYTRKWKEDAVNDKYDKKVILEFDAKDLLVNIKIDL